MKYALNFLLLCMVLSVFAVAPACADDLVSGKYVVRGTDPGGLSKYSGVVRLSCESDACTFEGLVDGEPFSGVGLYDSNSKILSLAFRGEDTSYTGVTVLKWDGKKLSGKWVYGQNPHPPLGTEEWVPLN